MVSKKKSTRTSRLLAGMAKEQQEETAHRMRVREIDAAAKLREEKSVLQSQVKELKRRLDELTVFEELRERLLADPAVPYKMTRTERKHSVKEAIAGLLLSDLHFEEQVDPREVNGLNEFNLEIAIERSERLVVGFDWYLELMRSKYKIRKLFVPLLGDVITNHLHGTEDSMCNFLGPFEAVVFARQRLVQIFDGLLGQEDIIEINVPMVPGNHDRMPGTRKNPHRKRTQMSLMFLLADMLQEHYRDEPRIRFELSYSSQSYTNIFGHDIRGVHGDGFKYNKGVGGIFVAARRYISRLNATRPCPVTVFGHHHQFKQDLDWLSNGSLIGYSPYAANNGYEFEAAAQVAFLLDRDRGKRLPVPLQLQAADSWAA